MVPSFEWDASKDEENQRKHGVSFAQAQLAFLDPLRVIARDESHSHGEPRFYCFGRVPRGDLTVRFTYRKRYDSNHRRQILASGQERGTLYTNERLGKIEIVSDFLPRPEDLVLREEGVKITLSLSRRSLEFFKAHASRAKLPYQRIIRSLLETYADSYRHEPVRRRAGGRRSTKSAPR